MSELLNGRIDCRWTLLSPLSHIGETQGPDSFLATQEILLPTGRPIEVFVYSGNALRGMLRDAGAKYFQEHLDPNAIVQMPLEAFYLMWSGGALSDKQKIDIDQARRIRTAVPHLSIFGGGVGNQILPGKMNVSDALPLCAETQHLLPQDLRDPEAISWRAQTTERSFTRTDDAKDENKRMYLIDLEEDEDGQKVLASGQPSLLMLADPDKETEREEKRQKTKDSGRDRPQQMRYTMELLQAGARLWSEIVFYGVNMVELGALVAAFDEWGRNPILGGASGKGMGRVVLESQLYLDKQEPEHFLTVDWRRTMLGERAKEAKRKYDECLETYRNYLQDNKEGLVELIGA